MRELLEVYDLKGKLIKVQERDKYYSDIKKEFSSTGKISRQIKSIRLLLMNSKGRLYLQKRSKLKEGNPGLYDKTVGGHVLKGNTFDMTVVRECAEELGVPVSILSDKEFDGAIKNTDLSVVGIFRKVDYINRFESVRLTNKGKEFMQPWMNAFYIGYYDGTIRFVDGESSGVEVYSLPELKKEIKEKPERFTEDLNFMVKKYKKFLKPIR